MTNRFNLIDQKWIPIEAKASASLRDVFTDHSLSTIGGNPLQKISLLKLLLAIAQSAYTPEDEKEWTRIGREGISDICIKYLEKNYDLFYLYGEKPFLQMPILEKMKDKDGKILPAVPICRNYIPDLPSENDTLLFQSQAERNLSDAEKALFIISLMNYALGGKRVVKKVPPLSKDFNKESDSAKSSPSIGNYVGYQNSFLYGASIVETIWLNIYTKNNLSKHPSWGVEPIIPPWEKMPTGESDDAANQIKRSFMSTLISMSRFVLLKDDGIIYVEGIQYPSHKNGWNEPFITMDNTGKVLWLDPSKRPWRNLTALLSSTFQSNTSTFDCPQISFHLGRARSQLDHIGIYSGGLKVRGNAGDQSVKQDDDYLESRVILNSKDMGYSWYSALESEMSHIDKIANSLWHSVTKYYSLQGNKKSKHSDKAKFQFWLECENIFQNLIDSIEDSEKNLAIHKQIVSIAMNIYDDYCYKSTAKQIESWAIAIPKLGWYLKNKQEIKEAPIE